MNGFSNDSGKNRKQRKPKEGEITIENITGVKAKSKKYQGEYIDYEEIKD